MNYITSENGKPINSTNQFPVADSALSTKIGEVQASPTANTLLARLKDIATALTASLPAGTNLLGKVGIDNGIIQNAFSITPHDTNDLANTTIALYVGVEGDVKVDLAGTGTAIVLKALAAGVWHPIAVTRVYDTDTDATDIVGAY